MDQDDDMCKLLMMELAKERPHLDGASEVRCLAFYSRVLLRGTIGCRSSELTRSPNREKKRRRISGWAATNQPPRGRCGGVAKIRGFTKQTAGVQ